MKNPKFITFTGVDDRTPVDGLRRLSSLFPIEWGVLLSATNKDARYPSTQTVRELLETDLKMSGHICGRWAREIAEHGIIYKARFSIDAFQRLQINGELKKQGGMHSLLKDRNGVIVQCEMFRNAEGYYQELFDVSGGRGLHPVSFPSYPGRFCGYAGGINPRNVLHTLDCIKSPSNEYWIDMESGVRTAGWFDLNKVQQVCELVYGK
jgi:hypothetical protein